MFGYSHARLNPYSCVHLWALVLSHFPLHQYQSTSTTGGDRVGRRGTGEIPIPFPDQSRYSRGWVGAHSSRRPLKKQGLFAKFRRGQNHDCQFFLEQHRVIDSNMNSHECLSICQFSLLMITRWFVWGCLGPS